MAFIHGHPQVSGKSACLCDTKHFVCMSKEGYLPIYIYIYICEQICEQRAPRTMRRHDTWNPVWIQIYRGRRVLCPTRPFRFEYAARLQCGELVQSDGAPSCGVQYLICGLWVAEIQARAYLHLFKSIYYLICGNCIHMDWGYEMCVERAYTSIFKRK